MTTISTTLSGVPASGQALAIARLIAGQVSPLPAPKAILHIATSDRALESLAQALAFFAPEAEVLSFPAWDTMPYDRASPKPSIMAERMRCLAALASGQSRGNRIVLTTASAVLQKLPPREMMQKISFSVRKGEKLKQDALISYLVEQGYHRSGKAMEAGEFALRGGIIDIIPSGAVLGVRLDLFGDEVEASRNLTR
jgi:transcription-repair coupling factor (superfamily II helicase)